MNRHSYQTDWRVEFITLWATYHESLGGSFPVAVDVLRDDLAEYFGGSVASDALRSAWQLAQGFARSSSEPSDGTLLTTEDLSVLSARTKLRRWRVQKKLEILGIIHQFRGDRAAQDSRQQPTLAVRPAGPRRLFDKVSGELMWSLAQSAKYHT